MMDIEGQAATLRKQIEKLDWQINNDMLTKKQKEKRRNRLKT